MQKILQQLNLLMENKITLYGASGHCKVIIDILQCNNVCIENIFDDNQNKEKILEYPILHSSKVDVNSINKVIFSIGNNLTRRNLSKKWKLKYAKAIHPSAVISKFSNIDVGTVVMARAVINPDVTIGKHCIINSGAIIEHDCLIQDFVHISPNVSLAGGVEVGEGTHIGIGAIVIQGLKIGKWATIGAGAVIINDIPDYAVVVGNPGKIIKYNTKINE
jgi:sugar O-acyltransferase (sialic acid O-acetyltransferase NeuD family)